MKSVLISFLLYKDTTITRLAFPLLEKMVSVIRMGKCEVFKFRQESCIVVVTWTMAPGHMHQEIVDIWKTNCKKSSSQSFEAVQWIRCGDPVLQNHNEGMMIFSEIIWALLQMPIVSKLAIEARKQSPGTTDRKLLYGIYAVFPE